MQWRRVDAEITWLRHHYRMLSCGKFYANMQHSKKVLPFGASSAANYASTCCHKQQGNSWIMQIGNGSPLSIRREWKKAQDHDHHGVSSQQTSAVFAS